jgi:ribosomal protein L32
MTTIITLPARYTRCDGCGGWIKTNRACLTCSILAVSK